MPPNYEISQDDMSEARNITLAGRATEVDDRPMTVTTAGGKLTHIYHFTLTGTAGSVQVTAWDRVPDFAKFRLGETVEISNVSVKPTSGVFAEYGPFGVNFGKSSRVSPLSKDAPADSAFPKASVRVQRGTSLATSALLTPPIIKKCGREAYIRPDCPDGALPFCSKIVGKRHAVCDACGFETAGRPACPATGLAHE